MAKGFGGMGGMNMNALMKQAQKMQKQMEETQAALAEQVIETTSGGGAVKVLQRRRSLRQSQSIRMLLIPMMLKCLRTLFLQP